MELLAAERFVIVNRSGAAALHADGLAALGYPAGRTTVLEIESPPVSASAVRARVAAGEGAGGLIPAEVASLISRLGLYRSRPAMVPR